MATRAVRAEATEKSEATDALDVINALAGGQTRSSLELVTDFGISYDALLPILRDLLDQRLVTEVYSAGPETFYALAQDFDRSGLSLDPVSGSVERSVEATAEPETTDASAAQAAETAPAA
jgi:hypothetical protein